MWLLKCMFKITYLFLFSLFNMATKKCKMYTCLACEFTFYFCWTVCPSHRLLGPYAFSLRPSRTLWLFGVPFTRQTVCGKSSPHNQENTHKSIGYLLLSTHKIVMLLALFLPIIPLWPNHPAHYKRPQQECHTFSFLYPLPGPGSCHILCHLLGQMTNQPAAVASVVAASGKDKENWLSLKMSNESWCHSDLYLPQKVVN